MALKGRARQYAYLKQDRLMLENCQDTAVWTASADVTGIETSTNHREGSASISFDKSGTTTTVGQISKTLDSDRPLNLTDFANALLRLWINVSSVTNIASVQFLIGTSASHHNVYTYDDDELKAGEWNMIEFDIDNPASLTGNGADLSAVTYFAVKVNFDATANTLTDILVDSISIRSRPDTSAPTARKMYHGKTTVTTAGTEVPITTAKRIRAINVKARSVNTGLIYVGINGVSSSDGYELAAGESVTIELDDSSKVYVDSAVNGEGVTWIAIY